MAAILSRHQCVKKSLVGCPFRDQWRRKGPHGISSSWFPSKHSACPYHVFLYFVTYTWVIFVRDKVHLICWVVCQHCERSLGFCLCNFGTSKVRFLHNFIMTDSYHYITLQWHHNDHDSVSNHQPHDCLLNRLFRRRSKKTSKLRVTCLCAGNSPGTGEFPAQMASNAENASIWWRHHDVKRFCRSFATITKDFLTVPPTTVF